LEEKITCLRGWKIGGNINSKAIKWRKRQRANNLEKRSYKKLKIKIGLKLREKIKVNEMIFHSLVLKFNQFFIT
jgi:hypothetical protein